ncbi:MAG: MMPL family transporter, partial [Elusimicrobia bacterium]|nr:MMPL family transporter [Elusimicrobiota bacterium]MBD3411575.1 MMPL family transporter [Elusimicrobiota bacterium]
YLSKSTPGKVRPVLDKKFKEINMPEGYYYRYAGNYEFEDETNRELGGAFLLAVILTYMLLVAILNSFTYPFVIISSVATSFLGVFLFLFFFDFTFNVGSQMTIIMLVGLVVNSAILMLDYALTMLKEGKDIQEALWLGASVKFRAIVMTSLAIICGALPQVFDIWEVKASMGGVIVGGMLASIFFTFTLIPVLFWYVYRFQRFIKHILRFD